MPRVALVDRFCARLGAAPLVAVAPGMGWMLIEVVPVIVWARLTGAFSFDGGYWLVAWLSQLGAGPSELAWLPLLLYLGSALHLPLVWIRLARRDPARHCLIFTWIGRCGFLGVVLLPLLLGLNGGWVIAAVLACVALSQTALLAGAASWMTWSQALVPAALRGRFLAWRQVAGLGATILATAALAAIWPADPDRDTYTWWVGGLLLVATVIGILATIPLNWAPRPPPNPEPTPGRWPGLRAATPAFQRFLAWNMLMVAMQACALVWVRPLAQDAGISDRFWAGLEAWVRLPLMLAGYFLGGWLLPRVGATALLIAGTSLFCAWCGGLLLVPSFGHAALVGATICEGMARGLHGVAFMGRIFEVAPARDPRWMALILACGGLAGVAASSVIRALVPWLEADFGHAAATWWPVAGGLACGLLALIPALRSRQQERRQLS